MIDDYTNPSFDPTNYNIPGVPYSATDTSYSAPEAPPENSGAPTQADISADTSGSTTMPDAAAPTQSSSGGGGALSKVLSSLGLGGGNTSNTAALNAAIGLLSAYGKYKSNAAGAKLPNMPAMGALPTLPGSNTAGYGPNGGYNFANYGKSGAGNGYAPRTPSTPAPSYFTYGSGPEHQFFQQVTGKGAPIAPVTMAAGGAVPTFDMGGMVPNMGATPRPAAAPQPMLGPAPPKPMAPQGPPPAPMGAPQPRPPSTMMQRMQAVKPFARGGTVPHFDAGGMASYNNMMNTIAAGNLASQRAQKPKAGFGPNDDDYPFNLKTALNDPKQLIENKHQTDARHFREASSASQSAGYASGGAPQGALHAAMNPGVSRHVTGPGDGTSDSIPARLANGEYVMDAQLVSMLGNGDNSAGAKRLDEFRQNVRAHKGAALAKGKMAPDAKPLHKYMGGQ